MKFFLRRTGSAPSGLAGHGLAAFLLFFGTFLAACGARLAAAATYEFDLHLHSEDADIFDSSGVGIEEAEADGAMLPVVSAAKGTRPAGTQWDFTGTTSGGSLWVLPKSQDVNLIFLGIGAEEVAPADLAGTITLAFDSLSGPAGAAFSMWDVDAFATPVPLVTSASGFGSVPNQITVVPGSHSHYNVGFTAPGLYDVTFTASATLAAALGGGSVTGTATYSFGVFDTGDAYPAVAPTPGPYTFFDRSFDNFMLNGGHVDLGTGLVVVPEPSSLALAGAAVVALMVVVTRRSRRGGGRFGSDQ
jgi:surface-anchored protein